MTKEKARRQPIPAGPPPGEAKLREAALAHLARFAATELGLRRVLERKVDRWARRAEAEGQDTAPAAEVRALAAQVARQMVALGAVDDAAFAMARARRLAKAGRSRRAIAAHLAGKGVAREVAAAALPEEELDAALAQCRRRRIGPFAPAPMEREARMKAMGALARAGFGRDVAEAALDMAPEEAEERLLRLKQG
ncbi:RecX family transcriptional regulator [Belnapia sp. T18]|uniref:Regulatory protein RecX n=1 Tax=Belnapia arida TaxID=2804533 RepID=A0ABS1TVP1_9PROT|nr:RecX family transcriptional regulator [Belnapia arida]MBL6076516.1 RecX family transcriptional regulator [Belnapia arida]